MTDQLTLFSGLPPEPRQQPAAGGQQAGGEEIGWHRGHRIVRRNASWVYADTGLAVTCDPFRDCGRCGRPVTSEGHDGCLGHLPGVDNACCGHGRTADAYVVHSDGARRAGEEAIREQERLLGYPAGWAPSDLPEPAATAVRNEPVLANIAAGLSVHRLHNEQGTVVSRGRAAGIAYLTNRAQQAVIAAAWAAAQET